jgi:hypothetical protein
VVTGCGLRILRARVKKSVATLTVEVSRPGRLSGHGIGVGWTSRRVTKRGNVAFKLRLSKYGKRLRVRRHRAHRHLKVRVIVRQGNLMARRTVVFR